MYKWHAMRINSSIDAIRSRIRRGMNEVDAMHTPNTNYATHNIVCGICGIEAPNVELFCAAHYISRKQVEQLMKIGYIIQEACHFEEKRHNGTMTDVQYWEEGPHTTAEK
jgi:hypothetical protein